MYFTYKGDEQVSHSMKYIIYNLCKNSSLMSNLITVLLSKYLRELKLFHEDNSCHSHKNQRFWRKKVTFTDLKCQIRISSMAFTEKKKIFLF